MKNRRQKKVQQGRDTLSPPPCADVYKLGLYPYPDNGNRNNICPVSTRKKKKKEERHNALSNIFLC